MRRNRDLGAGVDLRAMQVAVTIAERGTVSGAAAVLHLSPSSVSQTLAKLEGELGINLFHRLPRGMRCTAAGEVFVEAARRAIRQAEAAVQAVAAVDGLLAGRVHLATVSGYLAPVETLITRFAAAHPSVVPVVHRPRASSYVVEMVRKGECEIGVVQRADARPGMRSVRIGDDETMVVIPVGHPLAGHESVRVRDLDGLPMIMPGTNPVPSAVIESMFARYGIAPRVVAEADDLHLLLELVGAGIGFTIMPASSIPRRLGDDLLVVGLDPPVPRQLCLIARDEPLSPAGAALLDMAAELFGRADGG
ncbi:MAG: LysR family transcriptional regulator [Acidimicrobiales bacterium]|nr:LysR family transcriptional regulator [Acidimicrobiales bacterium]